MLIDNLVLGFLPLDLEIGFRNGSWLDVLHVVDVDFLSDEVRLLQTSLVVVVYVPVDHTEFTGGEPELGSEHH